MAALRLICILLCLLTWAKSSAYADTFLVRPVWNKEVPFLPDHNHESRYRTMLYQLQETTKVPLEEIRAYTRSSVLPVNLPTKLTEKMSKAIQTSSTWYYRVSEDGGRWVIFTDLYDTDARDNEYPYLLICYSSSELPTSFTGWAPSFLQYSIGNWGLYKVSDQ